MCIQNHKWIRHVKVLRVLRSSTTVETEVWPTSAVRKSWGWSMLIQVGDLGNPGGWWFFSNDDLSSGYVKIAIENDHRNSGFSQL